MVVLVRPLSSLPADKVLEHRNEEEEHARWIDKVAWTVEIEATEINTRIMHQNHLGATD